MRTTLRQHVNFLVILAQHDRLQQLLLRNDTKSQEIRGHN